MKWLLACAMFAAQPLWAASYSCGDATIETLPLKVQVAQEIVADEYGVCGSSYPSSRCLIMESNVEGFPELEVNCYGLHVLIFAIDAAGEGALVR